VLTALGRIWSKRVVIRRPFFKNEDCTSVLVSLLPQSQHFIDSKNCCFTLASKGFGLDLEEASLWPPRCLALAS